MSICSPFEPARATAGRLWHFPVPPVAATANEESAEALFVCSRLQYAWSVQSPNKKERLTTLSNPSFCTRHRFPSPRHPRNGDSKVTSA